MESTRSSADRVVHRLDVPFWVAGLVVGTLRLESPSGSGTRVLVALPVGPAVPERTAAERAR